MSTGVRSESDYPSEIVMNRWVEPIEFFIPDPEIAQPIMYEMKEEFSLSLSDIQNSSDSVILAHETDSSSAESIINNGFNGNSGGMSPLRDEAVFGWLFDEDIGKHEQYSEPECDAVVLFEAPKDETYVSSYSSSAYLLATGLIDETQYEEDYVMNYNSFINTIKSKSEIFRRFNYNIERFV